ncbi:MAG: tetratricopeptide repeat protein [Anaerolineae bacterium]|nr:tetratricopeptide repeat protein [Phycisphaerae bacterium]
MDFKSPDISNSLRQRTMRWRLIVIFATLIAFSPVVRHEFGGWDDEQNLTRNPQMNPPTLDAVARYWRAPNFDLYVPMTWTAWSALARAGYMANAPSPDAHLNPYIFHTANLALHATSALLAFELLRRLLGRDALVASAAGALVFAVHPVQVEAVAWVSGMKDVLAGALSLAAIILFLDSSRDAKTRWPTYLLAIVTFLVALLSKPSAVVVPAMVIVLDCLVRGSPLRKSIVRFAPVLVIALAWAIFSHFIQQAKHIDAVVWWQRPLIAADAITFYLAKIVWPLNLGVHYGRTPKYVLGDHGARWTFVVPCLLTFALIAWIIRKRGSEASRIALTGALLLVIGVSPVLGLLPFDFQEYSTVADHYLYLAMLGVAVLVAWIVRRTEWRTIVPIIITLLGVMTWRQARTWHDALSIAEQTVAVNPLPGVWNDRLTKLLLERANAQADQGDDASAIATYRRVIARDGKNSIAMSNLASVLASDGKLDGAIPLYEQALRIDPSLESARVGLERARSNTNPR